MAYTYIFMVIYCTVLFIFLYDTKSNHKLFNIHLLNK